MPRPRVRAISNTWIPATSRPPANPDIDDVIRKAVQGSGPIVLKDAPEGIKQLGIRD
jgi:hypothetical protein